MGPVSFRKAYIAKFAAITAVLALILQCSSQTPHRDSNHNRQFQFREVWGYLMKGEEKGVTGREPFTDILYFGVTVNNEGRLFGRTTPPDLPFTGARPRIHLVIFKLTNPSLMHFCLDRNGPVRNLLIDDIATASQRFDGIQVDFESVRPDDGQAFREFLGDLKQRIPGKILSVAVPVRMNGRADGNEVYDYAALAGIADKIVVMAYDQHWETSKPGPIASLSWCDVAADYAVASIPRNKLIMGLPLYGRAWQERKLNRSMNYRQADELKRRSSRQLDCPESGHYFEYTEKVTVRVFYEDIMSIHAKLRLYQSYRIPSVAFWRIGQGPRELWNTIVIVDR